MGLAILASARHAEARLFAISGSHPLAAKKRCRERHQHTFRYGDQDSGCEELDRRYSIGSRRDHRVDIGNSENTASRSLSKLFSSNLLPHPVERLSWRIILQLPHHLIPLKGTVPVFPSFRAKRSAAEWSRGISTFVDKTTVEIPRLPSVARNDGVSKSHCTHLPTAEHL
jgi:hypothetical protein